MADELSVRFAGLLTGSYDCVDRIVLNAFFPVGCSAGGFRTWWRRLPDGSGDTLGDVHLMRMAGRFGRRVRAWAASAGVLVVFCKTGERKHLIAGQHLAARQPGAGVFLVLVAKAMAPVWKVKRSAAGVITHLERKIELVNHYSFHIMDPNWGHVTIKMSSCCGSRRSPPTPASCGPGGHWTASPASSPR